MKIAICITTRNRPQLLGQALALHRYNMPKAETKIFVVDDHSEVPVTETVLFLDDEEVYYAPKRLGIPRAKNKCLELAMNWGADHIFLFDDDCWPINRFWANAYIKNAEPHLFYVFVNKGNQTKAFGEIGRDIEKGIRWFNHTRGCMLYFERRVIETVGGYDPIFGNGGYEHTELSDRIHAAGLTSHAYQDIIGSDRLIHSSDEYNEVESTFTEQERLAFIQKNKPIKLKLRGRSTYVDFYE